MITEYVYVSPYGEIKLQHDPLCGVSLKKDGSADYRTKTGKQFNAWERGLIEAARIEYESNLN